MNAVTLSGASANSSNNVVSNVLSNVSHSNSNSMSFEGNAASLSSVSVISNANTQSPVSSDLELGQELTSRKPAHGQTGPKSLAGKKRSRMNALKHGRHAKTKVLPYEDEKEYKALVRAVFKDVQPEGAVEEDLVMQLADSMWKRYRMEEQNRVKHEQIFSHLDVEKMAALLEVPEQYLPYVPNYLMNMSHRIGPVQTQCAFDGWRQYECMVEDYETGQLTDLQEMVDHFTDFFQYVPTYFEVHPQLFPLQDPRTRKIHPEWMSRPKLFLEVMEPIGARLFYQAHFMGWKDQIRNWTQSWYLAQRSELREVDQFDLNVIKQAHLSQAILDKLMKLQKHKTDIWVRLGEFGVWQEKLLACVAKRH